MTFIRIIAVLIAFASITLVSAAQVDNMTDVQNAVVNTHSTTENLSEISEVGVCATSNTSLTPEQIPAVDGKIRVPPTIQLRTISSEVTQDSDAIIEAYMSNPPANEGDLVVFLTTEVPSNILIRSSLGSDSGDSGISQSSYIIKPGNNLHVQLHAICSKVGEYTVTTTASYYVGTQKDNLKSVGLATEFNVVSPSTSFHLNDDSNSTKSTTDASALLTHDQMMIGGGLLFALLIALVIRR